MAGRSPAGSNGIRLLGQKPRGKEREELVVQITGAPKGSFVFSPVGPHKKKCLRKKDRHEVGQLVLVLESPHRAPGVYNSEKSRGVLVTDAQGTLPGRMPILRSENWRYKKRGEEIPLSRGGTPAGRSSLSALDRAWARREGKGCCPGGTDRVAY